MQYLSLDRKFYSIFNYHFVILYHFHHCKCISIMFYLVSSLKNSLKDNEKNITSPILHEGLILPIMEHAKSFYVERNLVPKYGIELKKNVRVHYSDTYFKYEDVDCDNEELFHIYENQHLLSSRIKKLLHTPPR